MIHDEAQQVHAVKVEQVGDGAGAGAVVEHSGAAANHRLAAGCGRVREADARSEVVGNIVKVILEVRADSEVEREIRLEADVVLDESADYFFQKDRVPLAALQNIRADNGIARCGWRSAASEGVSALV